MLFFVKQQLTLCLCGLLCVTGADIITNPKEGDKIISTCSDPVIVCYLFGAPRLSRYAIIDKVIEEHNTNDMTGGKYNVKMGKHFYKQNPMSYKQLRNLFRTYTQPIKSKSKKIAAAKKMQERAQAQKRQEELEAEKIATARAQERREAEKIAEAQAQKRREELEAEKIATARAEAEKIATARAQKRRETEKIAAAQAQEKRKLAAQKAKARKIRDELAGVAAAKAKKARDELTAAFKKFRSVEEASKHVKSAKNANIKLGVCTKRNDKSRVSSNKKTTGDFTMLNFKQLREAAIEYVNSSKTTEENTKNFEKYLNKTNRRPKFMRNLTSALKNAQNKKKQ